MTKWKIGSWFFVGALVLAVAVGVSACDSGSGKSPTAVDEGTQQASSSEGGSGEIIATEQEQGRGKTKGDICHLDKETGTYELINVGNPSVEAHMAHGDMSPLTLYPDSDGHEP